MTELKMRKAGACVNWSRSFVWSLESISIILPSVVAISLLVGVAFYSVANDWDLPLAYYFAASVLFGDMYLIPIEANSWSHVFTLFYFLWGTTLLAGALAAAANFLIREAKRIAAEERKRYFELSSATRKPTEPTIDDEISASYLAFFLSFFNWSGHRSKYLAIACAFGWLSVGVAYGLLYEGWNFSHSLLFSLAAMSTAGNVSPVCEGNVNGHCTLGTARSLFVGTYLVIGVPIFALTVAQFAEILVERAIKANEQRLMIRPLTEEEFQFAYELHEGKITDAGSDESSLVNHVKQANALCEEKEIRLDLGDFIVLELLRLQKVTVHDLRNIKALFDMLDTDGDGVLINYPRPGDSPCPTPTTPTSFVPQHECVDDSESPLGRYGSLSAIPEDENEIKEDETKEPHKLSRSSSIGDLEAQTMKPLSAQTLEINQIDSSLWPSWPIPFSFSLPVSEVGGRAASVDEHTVSSNKISDRYNQLILQHLRNSEPDHELKSITEEGASSKTIPSTRILRAATEDAIPTLRRTKSSQRSTFPATKHRRNTVAIDSSAEMEILLPKHRVKDSVDTN